MRSEFILRCSIFDRKDIAFTHFDWFPLKRIDKESPKAVMMTNYNFNQGIFT